MPGIGEGVVPGVSDGFFTYTLFDEGEPVPGIPYGDGVGKRTETAGTKIRVLIPPYSSNTLTRLTKFVYTAAATAHSLTTMRPIGWTSTTAASSSGSSTVTLAGDPGPSGNGLAASDLVAIQETDGVFRLYTVSTYSSGTLTLTGTLTAGVASGAAVWNFGVEADTDPYTGRAHEAFDLASGSTTTLTNEAGMVSTHVVGSPLLVTVNNTTNAGTISQADWSYTTA